jgi:hypothetical protein
MIAGTIQPIVGKLDPKVIKSPGGGALTATVNLTLTLDNDVRNADLPLSVQVYRVSFRTKPSDGSWTPGNPVYTPVLATPIASAIPANGNTVTIPITLNTSFGYELFAIVVQSDQAHPQAWYYPYMTSLQADW